MKIVPINTLTSGIQIRFETKQEVIEQYAEDMRENGWGEFPAIDVIQRDESVEEYEISDGNHRFEAAKLAGLEEVKINVIGNDKKSLWKGSVRNNSRHGIMASPKEKKEWARKYMREFCKDPELDKDVAEVFRYSRQTIWNLKKELEEKERIVFSEIKVGADGKSYCTNHEKREPKPEPAPAIPTPCPNMARCEICGEKILADLADAPDSTWLQVFNHETGKYQYFCGECKDSYYAKLESEIENDVVSRVQENEVVVSGGVQNFPAAVNPIRNEPASPIPTEPVKLKTYAMQIPENIPVSDIVNALPKDWKLKGEIKEKTPEPEFVPMDESEEDFEEAEEEPADLFASESKEKKPKKKPQKTIEEMEGSGFVWILNDGSEWELPKDVFESYKRLYPAIDVEQELRNCIGWNISKPKNRKTKSGILTHINYWLSSQQNRARKATQYGQGRKSCYVARDAGIDFSKVEY